MKFYPHWAKAAETVDIGGDDWRIERYGWSNTSREEALNRAKELVKQTIQIFRGGDSPGGYLYSDRPVREEIIQELPGEDGYAAVITRNAYGSLVLNTAKVLFADIDTPKQKNLAGGLGKLIGGLFGKKQSEPEPVDPIIARVEQFFNESRDLGARLYRTAAGYRCLITSHVFDPLGQETCDLLTALGSDPLYIKLCSVQECFRARLSPKPWRCGMGNPPHRFPWDDAEKEAAMRAWESQYNAAAQSYGICELVSSLGNEEIHPQVAPLVKLHDGMTCKEGARLA
jgi:hypothetical protein